MAKKTTKGRSYTRAKNRYHGAGIGTAKEASAFSAMAGAIVKIRPKARKAKRI